MNLSRLPFLAISGAILLSGCATRLEQPISGYTCCNLRPSYGWVSSNNVLGGPILPAGESAKFDSAKRDLYFYGTVGGEYMALRDDAARSNEGTQRWLRQIVVPSDPKLELSTWSPEVQKAVYSAKVMVGMTRRQVLMALSYPSRDDTKDLEASAWRYWTAQEDETVNVHFGADGTVSGFSGKPSAVRTVEFKR